MISVADKRLDDWGRWLVMGRAPRTGGAQGWEGFVNTGGYRGSVEPVSDMEASRTHDWFLQLPCESQLLLVEVYCSGRTAREHALQLRMSLRTLYTRLHKLHADYALHRADRRKKSFAQ